jgi:probable rRNA maturation factor
MKTLTLKILRDLDRADTELSILITGDEEIRGLNRAFRGIDSPTDVLSFPQDDSDQRPLPERECLLGDVVISMDRVEAQAADLGVTIGEELDRLVIHGILHLVGFDHEAGDEGATRMRELEEKYLAG